jgi:hypothetical protein
LVEEVRRDDDTTYTLASDTISWHSNIKPTKDTLIIAKKCLGINVSILDEVGSAAMRTMSVAQATVTQKVSHAPVMPKYGCDIPNFMIDIAGLFLRLACNVLRRSIEAQSWKIVPSRAI